MRKLDGSPVFTGYSPNGNITASGEEVYAPDYTLNTVHTPFSEQYKNNRNQAWGISLTIPIFNGMSSRYGVEREKLQQQNTNYEFERQKQQL